MPANQVPLQIRQKRIGHFLNIVIKLELSNECTNG